MFLLTSRCLKEERSKSGPVAPRQRSSGMNGSWKTGCGSDRSSLVGCEIQYIPRRCGSGVRMAGTMAA